MYRLLEARGENRERRDQLAHPPYQKPELLATQANQLWSWDISKLRGPAKWTCYHLYVILDVFSRFVVGWMIAYRESAELAKRLIDHSCRKQLIAPGQLTIHADRGSSMKSKPVALLMADLGVTKTHSRPHVSDDNPYSESQFRTLKYRPGFPDRFGSIEDARGFCQSFFRWYNYEHHHSGLGLMTPAVVHLGKAAESPGPTPSRLGHRLSGSPGTLRPPASQAAFSPYCRLDQQASRQGENSLNFYAVCLIFIDTHRSPRHEHHKTLRSSAGADHPHGDGSRAPGKRWAYFRAYRKERGSRANAGIRSKGLT